MEAYGTMFFEITVWMFLKNLYNGEYDKIQGRQNVKKGRKSTCLTHKTLYVESFGNNERLSRGGKFWMHCKRFFFVLNVY